MPLCWAECGDTALSSASGPSMTQPFICPRRFHLGEERGVDGRRHVGVDDLDGGEGGHLRAGDAEGVRELDDVLDDVDLDLDVGIHVEGGVGDEEYAVVALDLVDVDVGEGLPLRRPFSLLRTPRRKFAVATMPFMTIWA